jgi:hypothetical protein
MKALLDVNISAFDPSQICKLAGECVTQLGVNSGQQRADPARPIGLLGACADWPPYRRRANCRDKLAPPYSITSSTAQLSLSPCDGAMKETARSPAANLTWYAVADRCR